MLRSIKLLCADKLGASDGEIGHVNDIYFDDTNWIVRYVVADTGNWLPGRQVLIPPHLLGRVSQEEKVLHVSLTRQQIESSPSIDSHKPVSRQYEEDYYKHFGWPFYWQGDVIGGLTGSSALDLASSALPDEIFPLTSPSPKRGDAHLRSSNAVNGYHIQARDGKAGHICDFMVDDITWKIAQLVIKTGHRFSGKEVWVATGNVTRISYEESTVFVNLAVETVQESLEPFSSPVGSRH